MWLFVMSEAAKNTINWGYWLSPSPSSTPVGNHNPRLPTKGTQFTSIQAHNSQITFFQSKPIPLLLRLTPTIFHPKF